jgi:hypothetical protein
MRILDHSLSFPGLIVMNVNGEQLLRAFAGRRHIAFAMASAVNDSKLIQTISPCVSSGSIGSLKYGLSNLFESASVSSDRLLQRETFEAFGDPIGTEYEWEQWACCGGGR